ncbi:hypothetical protein [Uliginosibacterium sediminicola]|uniref:Uncharacterized protein n=1 Tax=Uliginosibacterium sediminicola TaxID=2024550 RepID=A0ABU9YVV6_9RHOO
MNDWEMRLRAGVQSQCAGHKDIATALSELDKYRALANKSETGMTHEQFDSINWKCGMSGTYKGNTYRIAQVDFEERLIGLDGLTLGADAPTMVRCENVTLAE